MARNATELCIYGRDLQANYPERTVTPEHVSQMAKILGVKDPGRSRIISIVKPFGSASSLKPAAAGRPGQ